MTVPRLVDQVVARYLDLVDSAAPGLVGGLYLSGSVALDDFHPPGSDVDVVVVTAQRPSAAQVSALAKVHRRLGTLDGAYHTWTDLAGPAAAAGPGPRFRGGRLWTGTGDTPVTWQMLARYGIARRGPDPSTVDIHLDPVELAVWCIGNLDGYWSRWLSRRRALLLPSGWSGLTPWGAMWLVTGVSRLHYTLATGGIVSKTGAARYALATFPPRWHPVVAEALRIRLGDRTRSGYATPFARRRDVLAFGDMAIEDAHRLPEETGQDS